MQSVGFLLSFVLTFLDSEGKTHISKKERVCLEQVNIYIRIDCFNKRHQRSEVEVRTKIGMAVIKPILKRIYQKLFFQFWLRQMINDPTRISDIYSCIDLIFTSRPKLVVESGVLLSLHPNCHHQISFAKYNLKIHYPPPYFRKVWDYQEGDTKLIR